MFVAGNPPPWEVLLFGMIRYEEAGVRRTKRKKPLTGGGVFQKKRSVLFLRSLQTNYSLGVVLLKGFPLPPASPN